MSEDWPSVVRSEIEADVRRVAERLRTLSEAQLTAKAAPYTSRATGARTVAQRLADAAQGIEERHSGAEPQWREVPELTALAIGDQLAVTGLDLVSALTSATSQPPSPASQPPAGDHAGAALGPEETVWARGTRRTALEVVADAAAQLTALRRLL